MKHYFKVTAKCGHVGKNSYYEGVFYEVAESASKAAQIVRGRGRVKHDHKDAILSVEKITRAEYESGIAARYEEKYFNCKNSYEQSIAWEEIAKKIRPETGNGRGHSYCQKEESDSGSDKTYFDGKRKIKKPTKYNRYYCDNDNEIAIL